MDVVRRVIVMGRAARNQSGIKTRQPLSGIQIGGLDDKQKSAVGQLEELIFDELNIKSVNFVESLDQFSGYTAKANFKKLGPKYKKLGPRLAPDLGAILGDLGANLSALGSILEPLGPHLGALREGVWGVLGRPLKVRAVLEPSWAILERSWRPSCGKRY